MQKEILQLEFWNECKENRCKFCSLTYTSPDDKSLNPDWIRPPKEKLFILQTHIDYLNQVDLEVFDQISFQGGEIMNQYDESWLPTYDLLLDKIISLMNEKKVRRLFLITSLKFKYEGSLLEYTINKFKKANLDENYLMVGTSYDIKYRFTKESERNWWINLGKIKRNGYRVHCTSILSQFFIDAYLSNDKRVARLLKIFPDRLFDLIGTIGDRNSPQMPEDFLPKRKSFMEFCRYIMKTNVPLWNRFSDQSGRRATNVFRPYTKTIIWRDLRHHCSNEKSILAPCGHFIYCHSYSDSDGCWACDIERLLEFEKGMKE